MCGSQKRGGALPGALYGARGQAVALAAHSGLAYLCHAAGQFVTASAPYSSLALAKTSPASAAARERLLKCGYGWNPTKLSVEMQRHNQRD